MIALDKDARAVMMGYAIKYRGLLKLRPVLIEKDLKNQTEEELRECLGCS